MRSYNKTQISTYDPKKLASNSLLRPKDDPKYKRGQNFKKTVSFDDIVYLSDEENIVTYEEFDCGVTFYPNAPTIFRQINRERNYISRSCEEPKCIPSNDQHNCFDDEQHKALIFLNPYSLWDIVPAAPMSLNHTNDLYFMSNQ